ncbi:hypothetical protein HBE96_12155 [Clostridium sp. P21]|uniref:DUF8180 domain-containing protein n=1 Tax=Clostridium muellerianum TaxID=2716538 RepID=A0A7Y0EH89_9CLOT|nr:hypothetical protein [Clostridium muellerianum]NMM63418.1 hypothetical protein [Clostridium muellerianum]
MIYSKENEYKYHHDYEHNHDKGQHSHEEGFKEWVEKAKLMGKLETAEFIQKAIEAMQKADEMLKEAKKNIIIYSVNIKG